MSLVPLPTQSWCVDGDSPRLIPLHPTWKSLGRARRVWLSPHLEPRTPILHTLSAAKNLTGGRLLAKNVLLNLAGEGAPLLVAFFAVPVLIEGLGTDRFGVLTLAWVVVGYFSLFDMGLGRAVTKFVADELAQDTDVRIPGIAWTGLALMAALGALGGMALYASSTALVDHVIKVPDALRAETSGMLRVLSLGLPMVVTTAGLRGILDAHQRFDLVNAVRVPLGVLTFLGPLAVLPFWVDLRVIAVVLLLGRVLAFAGSVYFGFRVVPALGRGVSLSRAEVRPLLTFGGWLAVSNLVGPILLFADRFFVASMLSTAALAYYATPQEVLTKILVLPSALLSVLFPALSTALAQRSIRAVRLYTRARLLLAIILLPVVGIVVFGAQAGLAWWVNPSFAASSYRVAQILVIGIFMNSQGLVSQAFVQAAGRPDLTAKLHLFELPLFVSYLWLLVGAFGVVGAALAWTLRVTISAVVLSVLGRLVIRRVEFVS
jgi:O-antigen/teichoic acid export membrane protein